jgi:hypothetical protein
MFSEGLNRVCLVDLLEGVHSPWRKSIKVGSTVGWSSQFDGHKKCMTQYITWNLSALSRWRTGMLTSSTWISGRTLDAAAFHIFHLLFSCEMLRHTLHYPLHREVISVRKCPVLNAALASQPWRAGRRARDSWNSTEASARVRYGPTCASPRHKTKCNDSNETGRIMSHRFLQNTSQWIRSKETMSSHRTTLAVVHPSAQHPQRPSRREIS